MSDTKTGRPPAEIRALAKQINFGLLYGTRVRITPPKTPLLRFIEDVCKDQP